MIGFKFPVEAQDKSSRVMSKIERRVKSLDDRVRRLSGGLKGLVGGAAVAMLVSLGANSLDAADNIEKLGRKTGATTEFLSEMRLGLSQSAVSQGEFETALRKINKSSQDASDGLSTQVRAFEKLGISVDDFQRLNTDQKFIALSEAISRVEDPSVRTQAAMDIMGRSGESLLTVMEGGAAGIAAYREEAVALGQSLSEDQVQGAAAANDALDKLSKSISGSFQQVILQYSGEIKRAADFTREYLPKALEFLMDIFRGLKAVVQGVVLVIVKHFEKLFRVAERIPGIGDKFSGLANTFAGVSRSIQDDLNENIGEMGKWRKETDKLSEEAKSMADRINSSTIPALEVLGEVTSSTASEKKKLAEETKKTTEEIRELERWGKQWAASIPKKSTEVFADAVKEVRKESIEASRAQLHLEEAVRSGALTQEEAARVAQKLGVEYDGLGEKSDSATELMLQNARKFQDGIQDAFFRALRHGENFWDSMKSLAFDILAQIAAKIATTFAMDKLKSFLNLGGGSSGGGNILSSLSSLFGGGGQSGSGGGGISLGSIASSIGKLFSGGSGSGGSSLAGIGKIASSAFGAVKAAGTSLLAGGKAVIAAIPGWGQAALAAAALFAGVRKLLGGGARSFGEIWKQDIVKSIFGNRQSTFSALGENGEKGFNGGNTAVFGANYGRSGTGLVFQHLAEGGENGGVAYLTGAQSALEGFANMLKEVGIQARVTGGGLEANFGDRTKQQFLDLWNAYADGVTVAVSASEVADNVLKNGLLKHSNLLLEKVSIVTGKSAFEVREMVANMDNSFTKFRDQGMSKVDAVFHSFAEQSGLTLNQVQKFFIDSGESVDAWGDKFEQNTRSMIYDLLDFDERGVTAFESGMARMASNAQKSFSVIQGGIKETTTVARDEASKVSGYYDSALSNQNAISGVRREADRINTEIGQLVETLEKNNAELKRSKAKSDAA